MKIYCSGRREVAASQRVLKPGFHKILGVSLRRNFVMKR